MPGIISWPFAIAVIYTVSTFGSIFGGWLPKKFIEGGMDANKARKLAMFIFALFPLSVLMASRLGEINTWLAVGTISIACAAHAAWSANIFTTVSDMFPKKAVASVTGIGGMAGAAGGLLIAFVAGLLLAHYTKLDKIEVGYGILFMVCGSAYLDGLDPHAPAGAQVQEDRAVTLIGAGCGVLLRDHDTRPSPHGPQAPRISEISAKVTIALSRSSRGAVLRSATVTARSSVNLPERVRRSALR